MKVLKGTDVIIKGKRYREGSPVPKANEEEFSEFLVEKSEKETKSDSKANKNSKSKTLNSPT